MKNSALLLTCALVQVFFTPVADAANDYGIYGMDVCANYPPNGKGDGPVAATFGANTYMYSFDGSSTTFKADSFKADVPIVGTQDIIYAFDVEPVGDDFTVKLTYLFGAVSIQWTAAKCNTCTSSDTDNAPGYIYIECPVAEAVDLHESSDTIAKCEGCTFEDTLSIYFSGDKAALSADQIALIEKKLKATQARLLLGPPKKKMGKRYKMLVKAGAVFDSRRRLLESGANAVVTVEYEDPEDKANLKDALTAALVDETFQNDLLADDLFAGWSLDLDLDLDNYF